VSRLVASFSGWSGEEVGQWWRWAAGIRTRMEKERWRVEVV
jgi:hypothetical protein